MTPHCPHTQHLSELSVHSSIAELQRTARSRVAECPPADRARTCTMPASLILRCPRCGVEHELTESRGGRCVRCAVRLALEVHRAYYVRLVRKRARYERRVVALRNLDRQLDRLRASMLAEAQRVAGMYYPGVVELTQEVAAEFDREAAYDLWVPSVANACARTRGTGSTSSA